MAAVVPQPEPFAGKVLTTTSFTVDDEVLHSYYAGLELDPRQGLDVPTSVLSKPDNDYIGESAMPNRIGHLWMRQGWAFFAPLARGATYGVEGEVLEVYPRRDRNVVKYETRIIDARGEVVARSEHHQSFLKEVPASGEVTLRAAGAKPGSRRFEVPDGERFGALERTLTVEMCGTFFHGKSNYHTDREASKELGFKDIVIGGRMTMAYAAHALEAHFGKAFACTGRLEVKFTNPVWVDDTVQVHGVVTGPLPEAPERTGAFVWVEKTDGTVVVVGEASVVT